jgi:hypothetical protein
LIYANSKKRSRFLVLGISLASKAIRKTSRVFGFRLKVGDWEVEISGSRNEVLKTVEELPVLVAHVLKAFESVRSGPTTTLTVKKKAAREKKNVVQYEYEYPKISRIKKCDEAVLRVLESNWGKWRPRTVSELKEALKANKLSISGRVVSRVLSELVKNGKVRRWKTDAGYVYILAEGETLV